MNRYGEAVASISSGIRQDDGPKVEITLSPEDLDRIVNAHGGRVTFTNGEDLTVIKGDVARLIVSLGAATNA